MLSETQLQIRLNYNIAQAHSTKLVPHLGDRTNYVIHIDAIKFYREQGMKLGEVHLCISFQHG